MENRRLSGNVCSNVRAQNVWLKYLCGLGLIGSLYIIIVVIHQGELIRNLTKHIDTLQLEVGETAESETRLYKLESAITSIKKDQESVEKSLKNMVNRELEKYDADKTGTTDFALEYSGGRIISLTPGTENFDYAKTLFGIPLCEGMHGPRAMLQPEMYPGHCWAFKGSKGGAVIKLIGKVRIEAVSLEHIAESVSPTKEVTSAPKSFVVSGLRNPDDNGQELGRFSYDIYGSQIQMFPIRNSNLYEYLEFRVLSNYDNPEYTCVYRFRVHGILPKT